jgi:hypothetical protein
MRAVEGKRSNRRWALSSALKFKELLSRPRCPTNGLGNRFHYPTPAHSGTFRPSLAKSYGKSDFGWSRLE